MGSIIESKGGWNTERSDELLRVWEGRDNALARVSLALDRTLPAPPKRVFPLLCPTREYDWIPEWRCELLHSESGLAEDGAIFRTNLLGMEEIWVCTRYEPNRVIHYTRMAQGLCTKLEISLTDHLDGTTGVRWSLTLSALEEEMNPGVEWTRAEPGRRRILEHLLDELDHYLRTGEPLLQRPAPGLATTPNSMD